MKRTTLALTLLLASTASADSFSVSGEDCSPRNFRWNDRPSVVARETIEGRGLRSIRTSVTNAPVTVVGDSAAGYTIEICKAASLAQDLDAIRVSLDGNELRADGPKNSRWTVAYRIHVPRNADVSVDAQNGPVSFIDVDGKIVSRSSNGPLRLENVSGTIDATTANGPIDVSGSSGEIKVQATNGPLSIDLDGDSWRGGSFEASTKNGPLTITVPRNYNSGVVVESSGRGPISCRAEACDQLRSEKRRSFYEYESDGPQRIELGRGAADVRITTVNGPVTIKED